MTGSPSRRHRLEHLEVEHRVVERDRDELGGLEADGAGQVGIGHVGHVDRADDDARPGDADPHLPLLEAELAPQPLDRRGDLGGVEDLALAHRVERQGDLSEGAQDHLVADFDVGHSDRVGADVETDDAPGHG